MSHFTIKEGKTDPVTGELATYVVGHDLGGGYTRHMVQLAMGDTADNPASTKGPIYGPQFVVYDCHKTGISVGLYSDPGEFYDDIFETRKQREAMKEARLNG